MTFAMVGLACILAVPYHADAVAAVHRMAEIFLSGQNPYAVFDLPEALARFPYMDPELATHLEGRAVLHSYNYPALSFLVVAPFVALGLGDIRWVYLGVMLVIAVVVISRLRMAWRPMALATIVGNAIVLRQPILAGIDPTWALLVIGAWLALRRAWLSPVLLGLAFAARQTAWFVAPFYVALVWHRSGRREAVRRALIAAAVAIRVNLPFFAVAPERFIDGVDRADPRCARAGRRRAWCASGLSGIGPLLPRVVYGALALIVFAVLLAAFVRWRQRLTSAPLVWPFLPLYFAWRSLQNYFVLATALRVRRRRRACAGSTTTRNALEQAPRHRPDTRAPPERLKSGRGCAASSRAMSCSSPDCSRSRAPWCGSSSAGRQRWRSRTSRSRS